MRLAAVGHPFGGLGQTMHATAAETRSFQSSSWPSRSKAFREPASVSQAVERSLQLGTAKEKGPETGGAWGRKTGFRVGQLVVGLSWSLLQFFSYTLLRPKSRHRQSLLVGLPKSG